MTRQQLLLVPFTNLLMAASKFCYAYVADTLKAVMFAATAAHTTSPLTKCAMFICRSS